MSLTETHPLLAQQWHPTKNGDLHPSDVTHDSSKLVWWICDNKHEWEIQVCNRTKQRGNACPYCYDRRALPETCLAATHPELAKEWHPEKNTFGPRDVRAGSGFSAWWLCSKGHEWKADIYSRKDGNGCPYCANKKVDETNCLATVCPEIAKEWHPTKNGNTTPLDVAYGSGKNYWWRCENGHEWNTSVEKRTKVHSKCRKCSREKRKCTNLIDNPEINQFNCLAATHPELARQWHPTKNGDFNPTNVKSGGKLKFWWVCDKNHEWKTAISSRKSRESQCPYCVGASKIPAEEFSLAHRFPEIAKEWHQTKNGQSTPTNTYANSSKRAWWKASDCGHEWRCVIASRTKLGTNCPKCKYSVRQKEVFRAVQRLFPDLEVLYDYKHPDLRFQRSGRMMELDIFVPAISLAVEYQGLCHYEPIYGQKSMENMQLRDAEKVEACKKHAIDLLVLPYWEWEHQGANLSVLLERAGIDPRRQEYSPSISFS